ncbi:component of gems protein 1-like [Bombina bombina]|uniref:component of gems protein 1-like n=1 Tax=Bombina bombina TaxID=8345 RepID=UPI00235AD34A|nr:component of gems protein 1-like [Bombina bombina]
MESDPNTVTPMKDLFHTLEDEILKEHRHWWDLTTLEKYLEIKQIPRGLRVLKHCSFKEDTELLEKWYKILDDCAFDLIKILIEHRRLLSDKCSENIDKIQADLIKYLENPDYERLLKRMYERTDKFQEDLVLSKNKKLERDNNDYLKNQVYTYNRPTQAIVEENPETLENASGDREIQPSHDNDTKQVTNFSKHRPIHRSNFRQSRQQEYTNSYPSNRFHQQPYHHQQYYQTRQEPWNRQSYYNRHEHNRYDSWNRQPRPDNFNQYDQHYRRDNFNQFDQHHRRDSYNRNYETPRFYGYNQRERDSNNPRGQEQRSYRPDFRTNSPFRNKTRDQEHQKTPFNNFQHNNRFSPLASTSDDNVFPERHARNNSNMAGTSPFLGNAPKSGKNPPDEQNYNKKRSFHTDQEGQEVEALPPRKKNYKN